MKKIIEYLPLLSICLIYFGFCSLHSYYKSFNVDIYAYITTSEIIMAFFPAIVFFTSIISTSLIQAFIGEPAYKEQQPVEAKEEVTPTKFQGYLIAISKNFLVWMAVFLMLNFLIRWALRSWFSYQIYDFQTYNIFAGVVFLMAIFLFMVYTDKQDSIRESPAIAAIIAVCYIGQLISNYRSLDAEKIKSGIPVHQITFSYHDKTISTGKNLLFIGQTSANIFLYDCKNASTLVFKNSEVDSLIIKN